MMSMKMFNWLRTKLNSHDFEFVMNEFPVYYIN